MGKRVSDSKAIDIIAALDPADAREDMYRLSYRDAALVLHAEMEKRFKSEGRRPAILRRSRFLALPVIFLHLHYLELQLKNLIRKAAPLAGERPPQLLGHSLKWLWKEFRRLYLLVFPGDRSPRGFPEAEALFTELDRVDPKSQAMRYAKDRRGGVHLSGFGAINVTQVNRVCLFVGDALDGKDAQLFMEKREREKRAKRRGSVRSRS